MDMDWLCLVYVGLLLYSFAILLCFCLLVQDAGSCGISTWDAQTSATPPPTPSQETHPGASVQPKMES